MEVHGRIAALDHLVEVAAVDLLEAAAERAHVVENDVDHGLRVVGLEGESGLFLADRCRLVELKFGLGRVRLVEEVTEARDEGKRYDHDCRDDRGAHTLLTAQLLFALFAKFRALRFAHLLS